jgi:hypothetical protein
VRALARKKVVFIIVEGPSDQDALELLLSNIFDSNRVFVYVTHGDITSRKGNNQTNILKKVTEEIKLYAKNNHLDKVHFQQVIHIIDMDGAYVPEECIVEDKEAEKPFYTVDAILTCDKQGITERNLVKGRNVDKLSTSATIWGTIPYAAYYMSCNLDHVLYNKLNSSDSEKEEDAYRFALKYKADTAGFMEFISKSDFSVGGDYISSWEYIKEGKHSLERHTNLSLCFPEKDL